MFGNFIMMNRTTPEIFKSSRIRDLSSPVLIISLYAMAFITCFIGLAFFVYLTGQKITKDFEHDLRSAAQIGSLKVDNLLANLTVTTLELSPILSSFIKSPPSPEVQREARRSVYQHLESTQIKAVMLTDENGKILFQLTLGDTNTVSSSEVSRTTPPLQKSAELLSDRLSIVRALNGDTLVFQRPIALRTKTLIFVLEDKVLDNLLIPQSIMASEIDTGYLIDRDQNIISTYGYAGASSKRLNYSANDASMLPIHETHTNTLATRNNTPFLSIESGISAYDLRVVYTSKPISSWFVLKKAGLEILTFIGPGILGLLLVISLIQNEWQKRDRRRNDSADVLARAEIASDMLEAGIIDWKIKDASVVYSQGWHNLYQYDSKMRKDDIFDQIDRVHPDDIQRVRTDYQAMLDGETHSLDHSLRIRNSNGEFLNIHEKCVVRHDHQGAPKHIIIVQSLSSSQPNLDKIFQ